MIMLARASIVKVKKILAVCLPLVLAGLQVSGQSSAPNPGEVLLRWTAPGDDHYHGQASGYQVRYWNAQFGPINDLNKWQMALEVQVSFQPAPANSPESLLVTGLEPGASYYFCLRAFDDLFNVSELSNSPVLTAADSAAYDPCGDVNNDGSSANIIDLTYLIDDIFRNGPPPPVIWQSDFNNDGAANIVDLTRLVDYIFRGGSRPTC